MKLILVVLSLVFSFSLSLLAAGTAKTGRKPTSSDSKSGVKAQAMFEALAATGIGDCGAGTCEAEIAKLQCRVTGNSVGKHRFSCTYTDEDSSSSETIKGNNAKAIFKGLKGLDLGGDSSLGTVETPIIGHMTCVVTGNSIDHTAYSCNWSDVQ